ncbi:MAG: MFS transporter [Saprospiraceae bacterium]
MNRQEQLLIFILVTIQFTHVVDFMMMMPLGKQFMELYTIEPQQFSLLVSSYAFAAFLAGLGGSLFIDRFDRRSVLLLLYAGFAMGTISCGLANSYGLLLAARALTGMFGGLLGATVFAIVGDVIPFERRGRAIGLIMTGFSVASIVGVPTGIYLASIYGVRMPFLAIGSLAAVFFALAWWVLPAMRSHLQTIDGNSAHATPKEVVNAVLNDRNQRKALLFTLVLMLGHFTIIPFIAPYMQMNIGFSEKEVAMLYGVGGTVTAICLPVFGRLADRYGHVLVFGIASAAALFSIFAITNLPPVALPVALLATSSFFMVASGRSVPATTLVTSVVKPEKRGSFMSIRQSVNEAGLGLSSFISGLIVVKNPDGCLGHYEIAGYFAILMSIVAVWLAKRLRTVS